MRVYEVLDQSGATIGFAATTVRAEEIKRSSEPGAHIQPIAIPLSPVDFCKFLTEKAGGAS